MSAAATAHARAAHAEAGPAPSEPPPSGPVDHPAPGAPRAGLPLTAAQSGMWYAQALDPASPAQNTAEYLEIRGTLDPVLFAEALHRTTGEADALRVRFTTDADGVPRQLPLEIEPPGHGFPLYATDLREHTDPDAVAHTWMRDDLTEPFDLETGPLFKHALFQVGDARWLWYQRVHHVVMDGFGYSLLVQRVADLYTALADGRTPGASPFGRLADLVAEDAAYHSSAALTVDRAHWSGQFADRPEVPTLAGSGALAGRTFHRRTGHLGPEATERLRALATSVRATWPDVLLAAQALYVSRATGSEDVVLGLPMMGRMGSVALRVPGMVMNVLPLRLTVTPGATFAELTRAAVLAVRAARRHQRYRYEDIRRDLGLLGEGRALTGPLVNVMPFDYGVTFAGAECTAHNLSAGPVDDLTVNVYDRTDGTGLRFDHDGNPGLYGEDDLARHQERYLRLLERLAEADPHAPLATHGICTPDERARVVGTFNDTARELPVTTLVGPIEDQAARTPHATALVSGGQALSYEQLDARANQLAHRLTALGVGPGGRVGVALPRSPELVVALLAVLKAGAAYLPLDPDYPAARLAYMLDDAAPACVLTDAATAPTFPAEGPMRLVLDDPHTVAQLADEPRTRPGTGPEPRDPAYVIYTSGSTGRPKGVVVPHSAIDNRLRWMQGEYGLRPDDRVLQKTPSGFDVSVWEFFWPLREGATLVVASPGEHKDPAALARTIRECGVTTLHFVPSMLSVFLAEPDAVRCGAVLRRVFCSGEALPRETVEEAVRVLPGVPLHNLYGPTEAAVDVTYHECGPGSTGPVPIGRPVWNTRTYVLDAALQPCPPGVPGELYLAGAQLADGYLGRAALTASRFTADPYAPKGPDGSAAPGRMYRTGDLARWSERGEIEYLGRTDHQVKLRGQRLEPGEVEAALTADEGVRAAAVLVREDRPGDQRLVGYITPAESGEEGVCDTEALRARLAAQLPDYMVPGALVVLDALPLSPNGKLDRSALPAPELPATEGSRPPRSHREETFTRLFAQVLDVERVGVDDGFFDLGGNSLLAARLAARIRETLGDESAERVTIGTLFQAPTPAALARRLRRGDDAEGGAEDAPDDDALGVLLPLRAGGGRRPLFVFHPAGGISWCYSGLLAPLGPGLPVHGLQARGLHGHTGQEDTQLPGSMEEMAADYVEELRRVQPHGPYRLLGWSVGGVVAHTVAVLLQEAGERVELLALMDAYPSDQWRQLKAPTEADALRALLRMAGFDTEAATEDGALLSRDDVLAVLRREGSALAALPERTLTAVVGIVTNNARLMRRHQHRRYEGDLLFFTAAAPREEDWLTREAWRPYVSGEVTNHDLDCLHPQLTLPRHLSHIGSVLATRLAELDGVPVPRASAAREEKEPVK
ncbi:amino acid adenylation domain-containing protein [Streptomyces sp. NPDC054796]